MKKPAMLPILAAFLVAAVPALAGEARVSFVFKALNTVFWHEVKAGAENAARNFPDLELSLRAPAREMTAEQQIQVIEEEMARGIDVLILAPCDEVQLFPVMADVHKRGVKVILVDSDTPWPDRAAFVGPNNVMGGYTAADYIVKRLGGIGKVAIIAGASGDSTAIRRTNGAREAFRMNRGMQLVAVRTGGWERYDAMTEMENLLTTVPDLDAVFCCSDEMALGALEAIRAAKAGTFVVGFDASPEACKSIRAGEMAASIAQNSDNTGRMAVAAAYRLATGKKIPPLIDTGIELITRDNVGEFMTK